ncbi:flagellar hook-length control protein FliK [Vibrio alginolyticus]|uniref:flagellar hook-length control protein FliK n=1 Tax=Vibrio alginolyticus TaxID=663 RepID=UPI00079AC3E3|nr:flagellar hook-length control protein FliK [Vibrio alginolyticus]KXZ38042.1 flagellar hook-length control protein FliK [Vibrio alginolyticus]MBT0042775.1 flagellar hook-length control protein FliK [Vibrio alginolyticus]
MIIPSSTQHSGNSPANNEGHIKQANSVHGFSHGFKSGNKQNGEQDFNSASAVPSFHLTSSTLNSANKVQSHGFDTDDRSASDPDANLTSTLGLTESTDLAAQAQALTQGMITMAEKQAEKLGKASSLMTASEVKSVTQDSSNAMLNTSSKQDVKQSLPTSSSSRLPISGAEFQTLLNQPVQGQPTASLLQAQAPTTQPAHSPVATSHIQAQGSEWAAVRVDTTAGKWGEQMMQVLHDRVTLQAQQNVQEAKIRLDPPDLGKLDLLVRVEGDRLSVHINANAAATREALMQVSERLRTELQEQNFVHVDVNVGSDQNQGRNDPHANEEDANIFAARESGAFQTTTTTNYSEHWLSTQA